MLICTYILTSQRGQPPYKEQIELSQSVLYSEVPLYSIFTYICMYIRLKGHWHVWWFWYVVEHAKIWHGIPILVWSDLRWGRYGQTWGGGGVIRLEVGEVWSDLRWGRYGQTWGGRGVIRLEVGEVWSDLRWGRYGQTWGGGGMVRLEVGEVWSDLRWGRYDQTWGEGGMVRLEVGEVWSDLRWGRCDQTWGGRGVIRLEVGEVWSDLRWGRYGPFKGPKFRWIQHSDVLPLVHPQIEVLKEIVDAVSNRCEVYLDGGVRRGTDMLKALALGARAVFIGRPVIWGLAYNVS